MVDDQALMIAVRDGEVDNLGILFEQHHKKVYNFFLRQTSNHHASEDLVQEVFYRILKYRHTYRGESKFTTWMFRIAHNAMIDFYRKNKKQANLIEEAENIVSADPMPDDSVKRSSEAALLKKALAQLSQEKREVLLLSRFENLKYEEIAKIMNCTVGTVKALVFRALRELGTAYCKISGEKKNEM